MEGSATLIDWDDDAFEHVLEQLRADGTIDAAGVRISPERLERILQAAPPDPDRDGRPMLRDARFRNAAFTGGAMVRGATFSGDADFLGATFDSADFLDATFTGNANFEFTIFEDYPRFQDATFQRHADFVHATFRGPAAFHGATFQGRASFGSVRFASSAGFIGATFQDHADFLTATFGDADFRGATFTGDADFGGATFQHHGNFLEATFAGGAGFRGATFQDHATFREATFTERADFAVATFTGEADFVDATFRDADFAGATFERARWLGPVLVLGRLRLTRAVFAEQVTLQVSARWASFVGVAFRAGADLFVRWAQVELDDADFAGPSLLAPLPLTAETPFSRYQKPLLGWEEPIDDGWRHRLDVPPSGFEPPVVSLRRAKVGDLALSSVDLSACRFEGAHGLDRLRLERVRLAETPLGWHRTKRWRLPIRWTRRQTIAEEHHWRAEVAGAEDWRLPIRWTSRQMIVEELQWRAEVAGAEDWLPPEMQATFRHESPQAPEQIDAIYRALRKGREDSKDEPGAADFYYGEMEMRRLADRTPWAERLVLLLYWLVSGYGLRASRALVALVITITLGAVLLSLYGFDAGKQPDEGTLLFAAESSISLLRPPDTRNLTAVGHVVQIVLRLAGPLFFGLALLSLRGRVKR